MFAGHAAVALAVRPRVPRLSLGVLVAASYAIDLIWPLLLLTGIERVRIDPGNTAFTPLDFEWYPWTHSLVMSLAWGLAVGALVWMFSRSRAGGVIAGLLVFSHWVLDFLTHRPDLPLWPGQDAPMEGLGLWNSVAGTLVVEGALFVGSVILYVRATKSRDRVGSIAMWAFVLFIGLVWVSGPFAPPPPSAEAVAVVGCLSWLIPLWAWWFDRHRELEG